MAIYRKHRRLGIPAGVEVGYQEKLQKCGCFFNYLKIEELGH